MNKMASVGKTFLAASGVAMSGLFVVYHMQHQQEQQRLAEEAEQQAHTPGPMETQYLTFLLSGRSVHSIQAAMRDILRNEYLFNVNGEGPHILSEDLAWDTYSNVLQKCQGLAQHHLTVSLHEFVHMFITEVAQLQKGSTDLEEDLLAAMRKMLDFTFRISAERYKSGNKKEDILQACLRLKLVNAHGISAKSPAIMQNTHLLQIIARS